MKKIFSCINPVIQLQQSVENDNDERSFLNSKGASLRGMIARRIGFSAYLTDNQERAPLFVQDRKIQIRLCPAQDITKFLKQPEYDYFDARGYINFNVAKYMMYNLAMIKILLVMVTAVLFLSDFGNSYLFLKLNTRIWKINYQNIFMELAPQFVHTRTRQSTCIKNMRQCII